VTLFFVLFLVANALLLFSIINLEIFPSYSMLKEASPSLFTKERSGFLAPQPIFEP
jgi:hypothetical protein